MLSHGTTQNKYGKLGSLANLLRGGKATRAVLTAVGLLVMIVLNVSLDRLGTDLTCG